MHRFGRFQSVRSKLMVVYLLLILFAMELIGAYFIQSLNRYFIDDYSKTISREAQFLANMVGPSLGAANLNHAQINKYIQPFAELANSSVYVLDKDGNVVGTSANLFLIGQRRVDPEVYLALLGSPKEDIAQDPQTGQRRLYLAIPVRIKGQIAGAVEYVAPMNSIYQTINRIILIFATGTLLALGLTAVLAAIIARTITGPITAVTRTARALAAGDFSQVVTIHSGDEIGELASTFNMLTRRLRQAMAGTEREKRRLQAVMSTMSDGVVATNASNDILLINPAACALLQCKPSVLGHKLSEILPSVFKPGELQQLEVHDKVISINVTLLGPAASADQTDGEFIGGGQVLVMRDVTEESRLENSRKRFVADVSHELRTPITTIKSYVEALLEGAWEDPGVALRFLQVMDRETNRMTRLIRDLLQLSRFDAGFEELNREPVHTRQLIQDLAERFALVAFQANVKFVIDVARDAIVVIDRDRMEQVLDNIVSNSLKYTPQHGSIEATCTVDAERQQAVLTLKDNGQGIAAGEIPFIFDRFYRVERARSRQQGGTGLGLSIAREIVEAHGGGIDVESQLGTGTTIRLRLPLAEEEDET